MVYRFSYKNKFRKMYTTPDSVYSESSDESMRCTLSNTPCWCPAAHDIDVSGGVAIRGRLIDNEESMLGRGRYA